MSNLPTILLLILCILGIGYAIVMFILLIRRRHKELASRKKFEQDMAELDRERTLIPTYTTDEERIAAIHRIMRWKE